MRGPSLLQRLYLSNPPLSGVNVDMDFPVDMSGEI